MLGMEKMSLIALARQQLAAARAANAGRSAHTVYGGHEHNLRQTLIALVDGTGMDEHESPGEATLHVIEGRVKLTNSEASWEGSAGDLLVIPRTRHSLHALADSVVLLTVVKPVGPHA
jgi:quercetin dioxygenase-like cupin family protein